MNQSPYLLDAADRAIVLQALQEVCLYRGWTLFAAHVRTNHIQVVAEAEVPAEKVMNAFKSQIKSHPSTNKALLPATEAHAGYGRIRTFRMQPGMSSKSRAKQWPFSSQIRPDAMQPILDGRTSLIDQP